MIVGRVGRMSRKNYRKPRHHSPTTQRRLISTPTIAAIALALLVVGWFLFCGGYLLLQPTTP